MEDSETHPATTARKEKDEERGEEEENDYESEQVGEDREQERASLLSPVKVAHLRELIDSHLRQSHVYDELRQFISQFALSESKAPRNHETSVKRNDLQMDSMTERKIIDDVIRSLETQRSLTQQQSHFETLRQAMSAGEQYLLVKVVGGRHFEGDGKYVVRMQYGQQRFESKVMEDVTREPKFDATFLVKLSSKFVLQASARAFDQQVSGLRRLLMQGHDEDGSEDLWKVNSRHLLHFVVLKEDADGQRDLVASHMLEWRRVLGNSGGASVVVELTGLGPASKIRVPVGVLDLRLDLVPSIRKADDSDGPLLGAKEVDTYLKKENGQFAQAHRRFCQYARLWWQEYVEMNPLFRNRLIKIFAENEWGDHWPACAFVQPIRAGRLLDTPRHAARFVSLIPFVREELVGGGRLEVWHTTHSFLSKGRGDCEDHALLLCSLLLGFGMRAYVCVGTVQDSKDTQERDHVWVATLSGKGKKTECVFWESLTGQRVENPHRPHGTASNGNASVYKRIGCLFNHAEFYANKQLDDRVLNCSLDLQDDMRWKAMDERLLGALKRFPPGPLLAPQASEATTANAIEGELRRLIGTEREEQFSLSTQWDDDLSFFLTPALSAYETERCTGVLFGNEDFQDIIKRHIPSSHSFKGYPTMFNHRDAAKIFHSLRKSAVARDILATRADHTYFALRVRVYFFPENVCAVWVMLAVRARFA